MMENKNPGLAPPGFFTLQLPKPAVRWNHKVVGLIGSAEKSVKNRERRNVSGAGETGGNATLTKGDTCDS